MKTQGVFESCNQGRQVVDLRHCDSAELSDRIHRSWRGRHDTRRALAAALPGVKARAARQMDAIAAVACAKHGRARDSSCAV